jgi:hypothetical protein
MRIWFPIASGGGVSAALTNNSASFSQGTLSPKTTSALSNVAGTFSQGNLTPSFAVTLANLTFSFSQGTLTASSGGLVVNLTSVSFAFSQGNLSPSSVVSLSNAAAHFALNNLAPNGIVTIVTPSIQHLWKPPLPENDTDKYTWKRWFGEIYNQYFNDASIQNKITVSSIISTGYLFPVDATSGVITITLPQAIKSSQKKYVIKKVDSSAHAVKITANGGDSIEGAATYTLSTQYQSVELICDGNNTWYII